MLQRRRISLKRLAEGGRDCISKTVKEDIVARLPDATLKEACRVGGEIKCLCYGYSRESLHGFPVLMHAS